MELSTMIIVSSTAAVMLIKLAVLAYAINKIAESFKKPFTKKPMHFIAH